MQGHDVSSHKATVVAIATAVGSGLAQLLNIIPNDIGKISVILGIILAFFYIQVQRKTSKEKDIDIRIKEMDEKIKAVQLENAEREAALRRRKDDEVLQ